MTTITIGLDGANWDLLSEWLENGDLPNLQYMIDNGVGGTSKSCLPPLTVPNWKCYSTGKNPGKLDVFRFDKIDTKSREHIFHNTTDFKSPELWDYLNEAGLSAGVINKPSTYPPRDIDGFIVAGGPDASETEFRSLENGFATPNHVENYLREELNYRVHPSPMISPAEKGDEEVRAILDLIQLRFEAAERLLKREDPDFLHLTIFYSMALQHYFWREEPVHEAWKVIDKRLGRLMQGEDDLVIMSDHGTCNVESVFYINVWLEENGYLATERSLDTGLRSLGITRERALRIAKQFGMTDFLSSAIPESVQKVLPWDEGVKRDRILSILDWENTTAIASNQGPIYLNTNSESEYKRLREKLIAELSGLRHPRTGNQIVRSIQKGEEHYSGRYAENSPDLILDQADGIHTSDAIGPDEWLSSSGVWKGGNMREGLFLMYGSNFDDRGLTESAKITDLAPTILHSMDVAVPNDIDGEVLDVFNPDSSISADHVEFQDPIHREPQAPETRKEDIEKRLVDLGYLE